MQSTRGRRRVGGSATEQPPSPGVGLRRSAQAMLVITVYFSLAAGIFVCSVLALMKYGLQVEVLLSALLAISGAAAFAIIRTHRGWQSPSRRSQPRSVEVTTRWVALAMASVCLSVVVNKLSLAALVLLIASALAEEVAFRRLPMQCQLRAGLSGRGPTVVFAAVTTAVFVISHGGAPVLPTIEKLVFGGCAYLICLRTRSLVLPSALHVLGNASASVWVSHSRSSAGAYFSLVSIFVSLLALWCASKPRSADVSKSRSHDLPC